MAFHSLDTSHLTAKLGITGGEVPIYESEYAKPRRIRNDNHNHNKDYQDLVSAFVTDAEMREIALLWSCG